MLKPLALILALLVPVSALAQETDQDFLTSFLEDSLSDAGRKVTITGFQGVLSARATIDTLTIADDAGVWLQLDGLTLDWSQSSLLSGALVITELSAKSLTLARWPDTDGAGLPAPEAAGFRLPDLPVSIDIDKIAIDQISLDESVLGQRVEGRLDAGLQLAKGTGLARLDLIRGGTGPADKITLRAGFDNATRQLDLDLTAAEGAGGLVVSALNIPGLPATDFRVQGSGPVADFLASLSLKTDGENRLAGTVQLSDDGKGGQALVVDLAGNLAPLFLPDYAEFLGPDLKLAVTATRNATGAVTVDRLDLQAQSLSVNGHLVLAANGVPQDLLLQGTLAAPAGGALLLPLGGPPTRIDGGEFTLAAGQTPEPAWRLDARLKGLDRADLAIADLSVSGSGRFGHGNFGASLGGTIRLSVRGLAPRDPALAQATGSDLQAEVTFFHRRDEPLNLGRIKLKGQDYSGQARLQIEGLETALLTSGQLTLTADDLSRFAGLASFPMAGRGQIDIDGSASRLSGFVDGTVRLAAQDLKVGIDPVDRLLSGPSSASLSLLRDETGTTIRDFDLAAGTMTATGTGKISSTDSRFEGRVNINDLGALGPGYRGSARLDVSALGARGETRLVLAGQTKDLGLGQPQFDKLLGGDATLNLVMNLGDGVVTVESANLTADQLDLSIVGGRERGQQKLAVRGRLKDLGLLVRDVKGPLSVTGSVLDDGTAYRIDLSGTGPGRVDAKVRGQVGRNFLSGDLAISGTGQAALANLFIAPRVLEGPTRFDLRLRGPLRLASLSGRVNLSNGRLSDPRTGLALQNIDAVADLAQGRADTTVTAGVSNGGRLRLQGPVALAPPFTADLKVALDRVRVSNPRYYQTRVTGDLDITGPLAGSGVITGALSLSETEVRVPESGVSAAAILREVDHRNEPAAVRATRARAGLLQTGGAGAKRPTTPLQVNLTLTAPNRIFLRGRGIDAELGGELRLGGTTASVVPSGKFTLVRGQFTILDRRLTLDQANLQLQGSFIPYLDVSASIEAELAKTFVTVRGPADNPEVAFTSVPELPQEEVLALLLFGRGIDSISPLQAAQLAQAVASLAGQGGEGLIGNLRKSFGLDDFDVTTADDGTAALKAGKYLSENIYTEVEVDQAGKSRINLNLDLRPGVTVKGRVGADGDTGIGIFIEKDY